MKPPPQQPREQPPESAIVRRGRRRLVTRLLALGFLALAIPNLASWLGRWNWICDNLTAFTLPFALASLVFTIAFLLLKSRSWTLAAGALLALNIIALALGTKPAPRGTQSQLHVLSANVKTANKQFARSIDYFRTCHADVLIVLEVDQAWAEALRELADIYPHRIVRPRRDNFGIAMLSRHEFTSRRILHHGPAKRPSIIATITVQGHPLTIIGTHPFPPVGRRAAAARNRQLARLADIMRRAPPENDVIFAGDLNVFPFSSVFQDFLEQADLRETRAPFDFLGSWPAFAPILGIRIDHILVSPGLTVSATRLGPNTGSDHRPIAAKIGWETSKRP